MMHREHHVSADRLLVIHMCSSLVPCTWLKKRIRAPSTVPRTILPQVSSSSATNDAEESGLPTWGVLPTPHTWAATAITGGLCATSSQESAPVTQHARGADMRSVSLPENPSDARDASEPPTDPLNPSSVLHESCLACLSMSTTAPKYHPRPVVIERQRLQEFFELLLVSLPWKHVTRDVHAAWAEYRLSAGWRFGLQYDYARRLDPRLVPYQKMAGLFVFLTCLNPLCRVLQVFQLQL